MTKRLLLTTAVGLILGTAAFAQTATEPSKNTDANKPAAQQTDKNAKPMSRVEKWQADKQTEAAEKTLDKNGNASGDTTAKPTTNAQTPTTPPASTSAQSQTPASNTGTSAQSQAPASGAAPATNAQTPSAKNAPAQAQTNTPSSNTVANPPAQTNAATPQAQPNAAPAQAQTPNAAPAANQQAQQPQNTTTPSGNTNAAAGTNTSAQTTISAGVSITDPQRTRISDSVAKVNVQPLTKVNFSVSVGTVVPRDVRLHPVPSEVVEIVPQYRDYRFFTAREEIVIVEPSTMKIVTVLPRNANSTASTTTSTQTSSTTTQRKTTISDSDRATIKKNVAQPRRERSSTTVTERDDPRSARAESRRELRVGDRVPETIELHDMPERAYREAPALREYRYMNHGSRTYVIEPRERTIIEQLD